jgi:alkanesulfonate monooxygenase SsuD/methylene tetrahydromethanopterin reductase-like flavin-dependent oxidoreductase (luciferase family)
LTPAGPSRNLLAAPLGWRPWISASSSNLSAGRDDAEIARRAAAIGREVDELRGSSPVIGTPAEIVDKLSKYIELGVQRIYLQLLDMSDFDHLEFFAGQVIPQVG